MKRINPEYEIKVETLAGIKTLFLNVEDERVKTVRVDMGEPIHEPRIFRLLPELPFFSSNPLPPEKRHI
jgi:diaminopimelate epimerase